MVTSSQDSFIAQESIPFSQKNEDCIITLTKAMDLECVLLHKGRKVTESKWFGDSTYTTDYELNISNKKSSKVKLDIELKQ
eukprot:CAMPEP_0116916216 /NCGR_PEP_ID=MMETSP0467-20121206/18394_1 /TAXON_ID=283647 /ORGANISM="Mesodinium pulex, Strain SPMC105" /LENGTH=80 /DNA_ID=CAMNT_0004593033 /DNA_START=1292 /DNA_END=1534 /DNA_ORIENTATION=-